MVRIVSSSFVNNKDLREFSKFWLVLLRPTWHRSRGTRECFLDALHKCLCGLRIPDRHDWSRSCEFRRDRVTNPLLFLCRSDLLPALAFDAAVHLVENLIRIIGMRRWVFPIGQRRGALLDLRRTGLTILQQAMLTAVVVIHRFAAASEDQEGQQGKWNPF